MIGNNQSSASVSMKPASHAGFTVEHHALIGSTNDRALELARSGRDQVWVVADQQQGGRGRNGRVWVSPPGNLYASLSLVDPCPMALSPQLGFVAGLAIYDAVEAVTSCGAGLQIKWPNDLLLDGAKLSGLLLEGGASGKQFVMTIGIGLNLVTHPEDTPYRAIDLQSAGFAASRDNMLKALSDSLRHWLCVWDQGRGFAVVRQTWLTHAAFLGEPITVSVSGKPFHGIFETLDPQGRLVLAGESGPIVIDAGDVFPLAHNQGS